MERFEFISRDERHVDSIEKKLVFPDKIEYHTSMDELPEDLLTTGNLLYLRSELDGESQAPLMKKLAEIAQELYDEYPEFCALVPFGSRTKGLSKKESDIDIIVILNCDIGSPE